MSITNLTLKKDYKNSYTAKNIDPLIEFEKELNELNNIADMEEPESEEKQAIKRIEAFFKREISPEEFAQKLRNFRDTFLTVALNADDNSFEKEKFLSESYYIREFCEVISPCFRTIEDVNQYYSI